MGIRLDQAAALRLVESTGHPSDQAAPRRPTSAPSASPQIFVPDIEITSGLELQAAVQEINNNLQELQTSLDIVRDEASGRAAVVVRDSQGEVIRQLPPEAVLRAVVQVRRIVGILLDETV